MISSRSMTEVKTITATKVAKNDRILKVVLIYCSAQQRYKFPFKGSDGFTWSMLERIRPFFNRECIGSTGEWIGEDGDSDYPTVVQVPD